MSTGFPIQDNWFALIKECGSEKAAQKYLADKLREFADKIESNKWPRVFGFKNKNEGPFEEIRVVLSYPWGG